MEQAQIGSVTAGPRKYFKKPVSFSVMDINVDIRGENCSPEFFLYKAADSREQRTAQPSLVKRLNKRKKQICVKLLLYFGFRRQYLCHCSSVVFPGSQKSQINNAAMNKDIIENAIFNRLFTSWADFCKIKLDHRSKLFRNCRGVGCYLPVYNLEIMKRKNDAFNS